MTKLYTRSNGTIVLISEMATPHIRNALVLIQNKLRFLHADIWGKDFPTELHLQYIDLVEEMNRRKGKPKLALQELFRCNIAGVQYGDYQTAKLVLKPGAPLNLYWERSNPVDSRAIRVELKGVKLGYIPTRTCISGYWRYDLTFQSQLHELREQGVHPITTLLSYNPNNPSWSMLTIKCMAKIPVREERKEKEVEL